ncbi:Sec-independent protein translocase protein TatA [Candidatus Cyrtobacter comes]|uniref:Sec-independent protein translocase protein TatA n=1 Tax=Candidatus Cyrtobacter comes TaxID=675776 RepID=A0ABU5L6V3_9RICK|nr:twin-arginine translocase TatA/TatE family subunit [Candidatus Cyrtobacter comes]MDZ5761848.1 Sec-independent protein translocase protein TatA [Candidatus Cyrtobacter comes]
MGGRVGELLLILLIVLVLFGANRLPGLMKDVGKGIKALRDAVNGTENKDNDDK